MAENTTPRAGAPGAAFGDSPAGRGGSDRPGSNEAGSRAREAVDEARRQAGALGREMKEQGKAVLSQQKDGAADRLEGVADSLHATAKELKQQEQAQAGQFVDYAAERLQDLSRRIHDKDLDGLINDVTELSRRSPATFFAGSVAAGFLLSRFVKSTSRPKHAGQAASGSARPDAAARRREALLGNTAQTSNAGPGSATPRGEGGPLGPNDITQPRGRFE